MSLLGKVANVTGEAALFAGGQAVLSTVNAVTAVDGAVAGASSKAKLQKK